MEEGIIQRLIRWTNGKKAPPQRVLIYPTNKCNLKCPFCFLRLSPYDVSKEEVEQDVEQHTVYMSVIYHF